MDEILPQHFSKKILFLSILFLLVSAAWYVLAVFSSKAYVYRSVAPELVFAETHDVQVKTLYDTEFRSATPNQELIAGTSIKTGAREFAEIILENNVIRLDENTEVILKENNFTEFSAYETDLPRLVFELKEGGLWINAFDGVKVDLARSSAQFSHSVGIVTYAEPINRVIAITGSADLKFYDVSGNMLTAYTLPLYNQVTYVDTQIVPDYAKLRASKLKKELKLAPVAKSVMEDEWVVRNTMVDSRLMEDKIDPIDSPLLYAFEDNYYKIRAYLTFIPGTKRQLTLDHADLMLRYLLGGIQNENNMYDANRILAELDNLTSGLSGDPLIKELFAEDFFVIGTVKSGSPAYLVKEYLMKYLVKEDGPSMLRSYLADLKNNFNGFELDEAEKTAETWLDKWSAQDMETNREEFINQSRILHRIILSYSDRVTSGVLAVFDKSGEMRMDSSDNPEETRFSVTEERLEISSALVSAYRYLAARQYLKTSYESLGIDKLDTKLASVKIFLEQAKFLAQRIEYAEEKMHGAAAAIDETDFREYIQLQTRDELLSENLKTFLQVGETTETTIAPPSVPEIIERFTNARISISENDIIPEKDSPFAFEVKNARLIDRSSDGSTITFDAVYDFAANAVHDVFAPARSGTDGKGMSLKGNFSLNDLVAILTKNYLGVPLKEESAEDTSYLSAVTGGESDEALRAQITAQNLAKQLLLGELTEAGIKTGADQINVLDQVNLARFKITEAYIGNPADPQKPIKISFEYNSSSKKVSSVYSEGELIIPGDISLSELAETILGNITAERQKEEVIKQFQDLLKNKSLVVESGGITVDGADKIRFTDLRLTTLPLSVNGVYSLTKNEFVTVGHGLYSGADIAIEPYFTELAYLFVIDFLKNKGLSAERGQISMEYPFRIIHITGYVSNGQTFSFDLDISGNRLKNVVMEETGASADSMTIEEFLSIAPPTAEEQPAEE
jgi:hypothetical protein